ncbi:2-oxo acid dehydrogenase subunit E2 [Streptomyces panaciradicis]|uniref:2-oxo acid dehydrogenase subunit E2 n=1 Tax=Streptomyces panaciradicis TaxID=1470261 RepID=UPI00201D10A7|nr:2-oxo acid dehydrogenase subunit E2 [Streptomyces panaciradicis]MCL6674008.1 2-oxo acid dehydrogenase subunit E2 [Streptomyces panaciradicis]
MARPPSPSRPSGSPAPAVRGTCSPRCSVERADARLHRHRRRAVARAVHDLAERTGGGHVTPDAVTCVTFTISNTGSCGALFDTAIVPPK